MPLMTLRSDLSWYGNPGWATNATNKSTRFATNDDLTSQTVPRGFDQAGNQTLFIPRVSGNSFPIDTALGNNGLATRKAQRGAGSVFPIGPEGQIHQFDTKRTGWYNTNRYGDTFDNKSLAGLADTYTANSPIDDMYNRYNLREDAYDPFGYAKPPFILRGIQREGSSDPQRWGLGNTVAGFASSVIDIPRGGPLTAGERAAVDVARIGKFLIRPTGLAFIAKQQVLHLMQPNTEGVFGDIDKFDVKKLYNPANTLLTIAGVNSGTRFRRYGLTPIDINPLKPSRYEDIHSSRNIANESTEQNRLILLRKQRNGLQQYATDLLPYWNIISAPLGPDSAGGLGSTTFTKWKNSDTLVNYTGTQYSWSYPYLKSSENDSGTAGPIDDREGKKGFSSAYSQTAFFEFGQIGRSKISLRKRVETDRQFTGIPQREVDQAASPNTRPTDISNYKTLSYGQIRTITRNRVPKSTTLIDFTTGQEYDVAKSPLSKKTNTANDSVFKDISTDEISLIQFLIGGISFIAYLTSLNESSNASLTPVNALAVHPTYMYDSYERSVSCGFIVAARTKKELASNWDKLKELQNKLLPARSSGGFWRAQSTNITIGNLYVDLPIVINSLSFDIDNETPWEISIDQQVPFYVNVDLQFTVVSTDGKSIQNFSIETNKLIT